MQIVLVGSPGEKLETLADRAREFNVVEITRCFLKDNRWRFYMVIA